MRHGEGDGWGQIGESDSSSARFSISARSSKRWMDGCFADYSFIFEDERPYVNQNYYSARLRMRHNTFCQFVIAWQYIISYKILQNEFLVPEIKIAERAKTTARSHQTSPSSYFFANSKPYSLVGDSSDHGLLTVKFSLLMSAVVWTDSSLSSQHQSGSLLTD
jgi:hypothetical protein